MKGILSDEMIAKDKDGVIMACKKPDPTPEDRFDFHFSASESVEGLFCIWKKRCIFVVLNFNIVIKMESIEYSVASLPDAQRRSIDDIKKSYPDEWILVGNPEKNEREMEILSGIVLYHSPDKREVAYLGKPLIKEYDRVTWFFNRVTPRPKRSAIVSIYSKRPPK
jgi:hypothetical protein